MLTNIDHQAYAIEAAKVTFFCLIVAGLFGLFGAATKTLLVIFNIAVMSATTTFSIKNKHFHHVTLGCLVVTLSIISGGIIGFYYPLAAKMIAVLYAGFAFAVPRKQYQVNIFITGAVMFVIFSSLNFNLQDGVRYFFGGVIVYLIFITFYFLFDHDKEGNNSEPMQTNQIDNNRISAIIAVTALTFGWITSYLLAAHYQMTHLYWIELTSLVIIQGSQQNTIQTSIKRILVNALGAVIIVCLFNYVMPLNFLANFLVLILFLFLIFFFSFSYVGRVLFIELFVLSFTHLLGDYQNTVALDRVILTLIGGLIVMIITPIAYLLAQSTFMKQNKA